MNTPDSSLHPPISSCCSRRHFFHTAEVAFATRQQVIPRIRVPGFQAKLRAVPVDTTVCERLERENFGWRILIPLSPSRTCGSSSADGRRLLHGRQRPSTQRCGIPALGNILGI